MDGECVDRRYLKAGGPQCRLSGIIKTAGSVLPFKFQELELVGAFPHKFLGHHVTCFPRLPMKIQTWKMPLLRQKWGRLNFEPSAAGPWAIYHTAIWITDYIKDVYRSAARRQGGIMSGIY